MGTLRAPDDVHEDWKEAMEELQELLEDAPFQFSQTQVVGEALKRYMEELQAGLVDRNWVPDGVREAGSMETLFLKRVRGFVEGWPLNQARADLMAGALRQVADELEDGQHLDDGDQHER